MIKVVSVDYLETMEKGIYEERHAETQSGSTVKHFIKPHKGFTRVPSDQSYSAKIKVKRPDGRIEEVTIPDKKNRLIVKLSTIFIIETLTS